MFWLELFSPDDLGAAIMAVMSVITLLAVGVAAWRRPATVASSHTKTNLVPVVLSERHPNTAPDHDQRLDQTIVPRRSAAAEYVRITRYLESASTKVQSVQSASRSAARQIDTAEMALNRLLADVAPYMTAHFAPTVTPRRTLS